MKNNCDNVDASFEPYVPPKFSNNLMKDFLGPQKKFLLILFSKFSRLMKCSINNLISFFLPLEEASISEISMGLMYLGNHAPVRR